MSKNSCLSLNIKEQKYSKKLKHELALASVHYIWSISLDIAFCVSSHTSWRIHSMHSSVRSMNNNFESTANIPRVPEVFRAGYIMKTRGKSFPLYISWHFPLFSFRLARRWGSRVAKSVPANHPLLTTIASLESAPTPQFIIYLPTQNKDSLLRLKQFLCTKGVF